MILGPPASVENFLKHNWRKKPGAVQIPLERILPLLNSFDGITPEILFDRTARTLERDAIARLGEAPPRILPESPIAWWATCQYRDEKRAIELRGVQREWGEVAAFLNRLFGELATPIENSEAAFLVVPAGFDQSDLALDAETFYLLVSGTGVQVGAFEPQMGGLMYFPRESRLRLRAREDSLLIRFRVFPSPAFRVVFDHLISRLASNPEWFESMPALLGFGGVHEESCARLEKLLTSFKAEVSSLSAHDVLRVEGSEKGAGKGKFMGPRPAQGQVRGPGGPPSPGGDLPPGSQTFAEVGSIYEDREWGIPCIQRRPEDINIVTYKRSGTTWLQMILYQLLTDGDLGKIEHIYQFSPYPHYELKICGTSDRIDALPSPRAIKTHLPFEWIYSPEGKYICVVRDGMDVALSSYHHHFEMGNGPVPLDVYFDRFLMDRRGWFQHVEGWWNNRNRPNVLFLTYRDLKEDLDGSIRTIAEFCGVKPSETDFKRALERSSFEYMKKHEAKFHHNAGVAWMFGARESAGFIRSGQVSEGKATLTEDQRRRFRARYQAKLGHTDLKLDL